MTGYQNHALQAILAGLNASEHENIPAAHESSTNAIPGLGFLQPEIPSKLQGTISSPNRADRSAQKITSSSSSNPPVPDASNITTWPAALKHITKHIAPNEMLGGRIRALIAEQHRHEQQWWEGRQAIVKKHQNRAETQLQATALLRSLGGAAAAAASLREGSGQPDHMEELKSYDKKVYGELTKMVAQFDRKLRAMGVPFYAIKHELVMVADGMDGNGKLEKRELRDLQGRVLQLLEDLFLE